MMAFGGVQKASLLVAITVVSTSCIAAAALDDGGPRDREPAASETCSPFPAALEAAQRIDLVNGSQTTVYLGVRGAALLAALNQSGEAGVPGEGLLVMRVVGYGQVIVAVIAAGRSMVCDSQLMTEDRWEVLDAAALRQIAKNTDSRQSAERASRAPI
jgi:hypothetical protein